MFFCAAPLCSFFLLLCNISCIILPQCIYPFMCIWTVSLSFYHSIRSDLANASSAHIHSFLLDTYIQEDNHWITGYVFVQLFKSKVTNQFIQFILPPAANESFSYLR